MRIVEGTRGSVGRSRRSAMDDFHVTPYDRVAPIMTSIQICIRASVKHYFSRAFSTSTIHELPRRGDKGTPRWHKVSYVFADENAFTSGRWNVRRSGLVRNGRVARKTRLGSFRCFYAELG